MEKKNVEMKAQEVVREMAPVVRRIARQDGPLGNQLRRAAQSVVLNIAEARGSQAGNARARFGTACGSAQETRAALEMARNWGYVDSETLTRFDEALDHICAITWCLAYRR